MYIRTQTLQSLMEKYNISAYTHGKKEDKLGDVFEDYCVEILNSTELLQKYLSNTLSNANTDEYIFKLLMNAGYIKNTNKIKKISASREIEHRLTGGNAKTDVIADITYNDNSSVSVSISVKQTTAKKVAMAEFDVDTIVREVGIADKEVIRLLTKHQTDASAKNFTAIEKQMLKENLKPYATKLVRWVLTGSPDKDCTDLRFPKLILKIDFTKKDEIKDIHVYDIDTYINSVMKDKNGNIRAGGFGTGLGWTYATGSKGKKIQFKG